VEIAWHQLPDRPVRSLVCGAPAGDVPEVVLVPGLGALGYVLPLVDACSAWSRVHLLDLPGYGHASTVRCSSRLADVAATLAQWLQLVPERPVLLLGHSTGAQVALRAAVAVPERVEALALAGPTFPPQARRWLPLVSRAARTVVHERLTEAPGAVPYYLRSRGHVLTLLRTSMRDRPEDVVTRLTCPRLVLRGRHDHLAPEAWARSLGPCLTLSGAHNIPFTQPVAVAAAVERLARREAPTA